MMLKTLIRSTLLLLALLLPVGGAHAQSMGEPCGDTENTRFALKHLTRVFTLDRHEQARSMMGVERVSPAAEFAVVADAKACRPILRETLKEMRTWPGWKTLHRNGFGHSIYRIGPYVVVSVRPLTEGGVVIQDGGSTLVFDGATLALIRVARI